LKSLLHVFVCKYFGFEDFDHPLKIVREMDVMGKIDLAITTASNQSLQSVFIGNQEEGKMTLNAEHKFCNFSQCL
jgi:hypothetical protein